MKGERTYACIYLSPINLESSPSAARAMHILITHNISRWKYEHVRARYDEHDGASLRAHSTVLFILVSVGVAKQHGWH